jgi:hypothetical protein
MEQIKLDIIPKGITPICHASQYDKGRVIRLNLMDGLQGYQLTDETVQVNVRKPDNNIVTAAVEYEAGKTYVDIVTTEQMTACEGDSNCEIQITKGEVRIASLNFTLRVEVDPLKDGIESETEIHNLEQQVADLVSEQYDADSVIFDDEPTEGHGTGYAVKSGGLKAYIPKAIGALDDVDIDSPAGNQALVWNPTTQKWENGEVSTVGSIDDLDDVDTTGKGIGDSLRFDPDAGEEGEWVAQQTVVPIDEADYEDLQEKQLCTFYAIDDGSPLDYTAEDILYEEGETETVHDEVESLKTSKQDKLAPENVSFDSTKWSSKTSNREIRINKYGKVVSLYAVFTLTSALSANEVIISNGGVPPICLNQNEYQFPIACVSGTQAGKVARVRITKDGGVSDWYSQSTFFASSCTYVLQASYITD